MDEKDKLIDSLVKKIEKLEQINSDMLTVLLEQSKHIRYLEEISKVKRL